MEMGQVIASDPLTHDDLAMFRSWLTLSNCLLLLSQLEA